MSSAARTTRSATPLLADGMRLTQPEFHRRYEQYPDKIKFELIGGVVYMGSPLFVGHARGDMKLGVVFGTYEARTPGVEAIPNLTHVLGAHSEHQPDLILRILTECGGQSDFAGPGFLRSAPGADLREFVYVPAARPWRAHGRLRSVRCPRVCRI